MLMMSRREGEVILIGGDIEILIARIGRSRVKVGIRAPRSVSVVAREVQLVRDENLAAAVAPPSMTSLQSLVTSCRPPSSSSGEPRR
jgi:carbon storage regulator